MKTYFVEIKETYQKSIVVSVEAETVDAAKVFALNHSPNSILEEDLLIENRKVENVYTEEKWKQVKRSKDLEIEIIEAFMDENNLDIVPEKVPISFIQDYKSRLK